METPEKQAARCLRAHRRGRLLARHDESFETRAEDVSFVIDPSGSGLVFPLARTMLELVEHRLIVPDEEPDDGGDRLEMQIELAPLDDDAQILRDRHFAYHGRSSGGVWVLASVIAGRFGPEVFDGTDLISTNTLATFEPRLCRACNEQRDRVIAACLAHRRARVSEAVVTGVDNFGIDVRVSLGVLRLEFERRADTESDAFGAIESLFKERS